MALTVGTRLGPYEILGTLGSGGMGEVYRAYDSRLDREVAIKVVRECFARDTVAVDRFHREVRAVAALSHPNIVGLHDFGIQNGNCYAVMELLEGHTMARRLQDGPLAVGDALQIGLGIVQGLEAAHSKGIIHRDIKPENIFLTVSGGVKILDFGLARLKLSSSRSPLKPSEADLDATETGMIMGTILYMSPEQARSQPVDMRSDFFSFGCVLYEMVTGRRPFQRATSADTVSAILQEPPPPLEEFPRPVGLDPLLFRCLEKSPEDRFSNAQELVHALRVLIQESSMSETWIRSAPLSSTTSTPYPTSNRPVDSASLAVLPFANLGPDKENDYFSDGLSEELINVLSRLKGLHVASRTSAFAYKGKSEDIRRIGRELNVANVLEGSVRKAGNRLRISVRLVSIRNGFLLWSETFDRKFEDIFDIQAEIAQSIARALQVILSETDKGLLGKDAQADVRAYDFYLRGMQFFHQFRRKGFEFARQMFQRAIEIDTKYARAYAGLAYCHSVLYTNWDKDERHVQEADQASRKALELDSSLAEVHAARGMAIMLKGDYDAAKVHFENAIERNPELFEAYFFYARSCLAAGRLEEAANLFEKAHRIRPEDYQASLVGAGVLSGLGHKELAKQWYSRGLHVAEKNLEQHPDDARAYYLGANAWAQLGNQRKAAEWAQQALEIDPNEPLALYNVACVHALQDKVEAAIDCLEKSVAHGFRHLAWIEHDSDLDTCRKHPRFRALIEKLAPVAASGTG